ncbi:MAG: hypothetical protein RI907_1349 [Pseudomonadota bacterium]|jgi:two-component system OmpR family sensor kinase
MNQQPSGSLRRRLIATVLGISLVWSLVLAAAVTFTVRHAVDELLDNALQESAEILYGLIQGQQGRLPDTHGAALPAPPHDEHLVWQVVSAQGQLRWRSHRAPATPLLSQPVLGLSTVPGWWRVYGMRMPDEAGGGVLYVAQVAHVRQETKWRAAAASALVTLAVGGLCAWWLRERIKLALVPLGELSQAVEHYDPMATEPGRLPATLKELEPMRLAIHDLGERLAQRVASERAFAAHAAHALRTPLAGMMAQLAVAQVKSSEEALPHLQRMGAALDRLRSVVTALLTLFRAEQAAIRARDVRVSELARHLPFESLQVDVAVDGVIHADPDLLSAALINLLDNAQKHGAQRVSLASLPSATEGKGWVLEIADDGRGMTPEVLAKRQAALDGQHYDQIGGLGLMLGDLIARAHGGRLRLLASDKGLRVQISASEKSDRPALA